MQVEEIIANLGKSEVVGEIGGVGVIVEIDRLRRGNEAVLFEKGQGVRAGKGKSVGKGDLALVLGTGGVPEANLGEAVFLRDIWDNFYRFRVGARNDKGLIGWIFNLPRPSLHRRVNFDKRGGKRDVLGGGGEIKTKIGEVVAAIIKRRVGIFLRRGIGKFDGDLMGNLTIGHGDLMMGTSRDIGIGFVGAEIGFDQKIGIRGDGCEFAGEVFGF